jgi:hypothetical protein
MIKSSKKEYFLFSMMAMSVMIGFLCQFSCSRDGFHAWNLAGNWMVLHVRYDNVSADTSFIEIAQYGQDVYFFEAGDTLSSGVIIADTIYCTDMYGAGISRIFIESTILMHSETPACEWYRYLEFRKTIN